MPKHTRIKIEEWRDIPGWKGYYQASDRGRIKSLARVVIRRDGVRQTYGERILNPYPTRGGRLQVSLNRPGHKEYRTVHRLVLEAFVGPRPEGLECCHWDDNPANNHLSNLRWDTPSSNEQDKIRNGGNHNVNKTHCPRGHLLEGENLRDGVRKGGINSSIRKEPWRGCNACNRASAYISGHPELRGKEQEVSDSYYQSIVDGTYRAHCIRGHLLELPNLLASSLRRGERHCISCRRARSYADNHPEWKPRLQELSDSYYEKIMGRAAA